MASAHHAVSGELSMRDERRPGLDGPGRMVKSREFGPQNYVSYENLGFLKRSIIIQETFTSLSNSKILNREV